ncbi:hypothetical protein WN51_12778 [Melipona quadrifasciata]|uniref:Uncharacterized protein n=1 Tax=Melipona quadrifasciata TaxID=166423 RepID=A0A0M9A4B8_9HYME|nr:hypothetical protein WN51_12778 [Melipona quadrifasciata]
MQFQTSHECIEMASITSLKNRSERLCRLGFYKPEAFLSLVRKVGNPRNWTQEIYKDGCYSTENIDKFFDKFHLIAWLLEKLSRSSDLFAIRILKFECDRTYSVKINQAVHIHSISLRLSLFIDPRKRKNKVTNREKVVAEPNQGAIRNATCTKRKPSQWMSVPGTRSTDSQSAEKQTKIELFSKGLSPGGVGV